MVLASIMAESVRITSGFFAGCLVEAGASRDFSGLDSEGVAEGVEVGSGFGLGGGELTTWVAAKASRDTVGAVVKAIAAAAASPS